MKRNYLVISIIALSVLLFFEITSVASLITEVKGQTHSSEHSSQSFKQSEQSTIKSQSTETANVKEAIQESAEKGTKSVITINTRQYKNEPRSGCQKRRNQL